MLLSIYKYLKTIRWIPFLFLFGIILLKGCLCNMFVLGDDFIHCLIYPFRHYHSVLAFSLFVSSFVFITKRQWWAVVVLLIMDAWIWAVIIYYQAWGVLMDMSVIMMAGNMDGFWTSVLVYIDWRMFAFPLLTVLYFVLLRLLPRTDSSRWIIFVCLFCLAYINVPMSQYRFWKEGLNDRIAQNPHSNIITFQWHNISPLVLPYSEVDWAARNTFVDNRNWPWEQEYVRKHHIADYGLAICYFQCKYIHYVRDGKLESLPLSKLDENKIQSFIYTDKPWHPTRNLICILVESFESWVVDFQTNGGYVMPNLHNFMKDNPVLYADRLKCQTKYGGSGDGQMLLMTGLLPTSKGSAALSFGDNIYPNYAHYYPKSYTINPCHNTWNQSVVNTQYGIQNLYEEGGLYRSDSLIIQEVIRHFNMSDSLTFILAITISSHTPFEIGKTVNFAVDETIPSTIQDYVKAMHYVDGALNLLFEEFTHNEKLKQTDIVITGDHKIFQHMMWKQMHEYMVKNGCEKDECNYVPLIIYSPTFVKNEYNSDIAYQMDIFPTILDVIGCDNYFWHGFGVSLLGHGDANGSIPPPMSASRKLSEQEAYDLSDKIIRNNYFATIKMK